MPLNSITSREYPCKGTAKMLIQLPKSRPFKPSTYYKITEAKKEIHLNTSGSIFACFSLSLWIFTNMDGYQHFVVGITLASSPAQAVSLDLTLDKSSYRTIQREWIFFCFLSDIRPSHTCVSDKRYSHFAPGNLIPLSHKHVNNSRALWSLKIFKPRAEVHTHI